ncbi:MAG TPA: hypothetical protein DCL41_02880, partial [Bdellovibrionales bacterium]|nr:hypothetical protein [Bdellovibrionales bacterium]
MVRNTFRVEGFALIKILASILVMLSHSVCFAEFKEIQIVFNTPTNHSEKEVKRWKKNGLEHTGNLLNNLVKNPKASIDRKKAIVRIQFDYPSQKWAL